MIQRLLKRAADATAACSLAVLVTCGGPNAPYGVTAPNFEPSPGGNVNPIADPFNPIGGRN